MGTGPAGSDDIRILDRGAVLRIGYDGRRTPWRLRRA